MNQVFPVFLFLAVASLGFFTFISVVVWSRARLGEREAYYRAEIVKKIAEMETPGSAAALEILREQENIAGRRRREAAKLTGLVTSMVGVALMIFLKGYVRDEGPVFLCGLIPLLVGGSLLAYAYLLGQAK